MKLLMKYTQLVAVKIIILVFSMASYGATYVVTTTADVGVGSFRNAIILANGSIGADVIDFSALPAGIQTITLLSALPVITDQLTIDGYTSVSYISNNPKIEIQCATGVVLEFNGASANGSIVRGLIINKSSSYGIRLDNVKNAFLTACWIGLSNTGTVPLAGNELQQSGIYLINNSNNNTIGGTTVADRNVISASKSNGIEIVNTSTGNTIIGNYIGVGINGISNVGNSSNGIYINACSNNRIGGSSIASRNIISGNNSYGIDIENNATGIIIKANFVGIAKDGITVVQNGSHGIFLNNLIGNGTELIGGTTFAERNVVSGNSMITHGAGNGISLNTCSNITIKGNWCGVDSTGLVAVPNYWGGLSFSQCTNCTIGGTTLYEKNILSGNTNEGFYLGGGGTNTIIGNYIGVGADGITAIGNQKYGLNIQSGSVNNSIGGTIAPDRNIISGNGGPGIYMNSTDGNAIQGNFIGIASDGTTALANFTSGIILDNGCNNNSIGGLAAGASNSIAYNGVNGITILDAASFHNSINKNSIYCNVRRGIELSGLGNNSFAKPVILNSSTAIILNGTAPANAYVEIFTVGPSACKTCGVSGAANDSVQGKVYIATVQANASGNWTYNNISAFTEAVTATASASNTGNYNTSEFSKCNSCFGILPPTGGSNLAFCSGTPGNANLVATGGAGDRLVWYISSCGTGASIGIGSPLAITIPSSSVSYFARWERTGCTASSCVQNDITINSLPTPAIIGNGAICMDSTRTFTTNATANSFSWTYVSSGTGVITFGQGTNTITLNIGSLNGTLSLTETTSAPCSTTVTLPVTVKTPTGTIAQAGLDKNICNTDIQLSGNNTAGAWSVYNGTGTFFPTASSYNATVSGLSKGINKFIWTTLGSCNFSSNDTVSIDVGSSGLFANASASADTICFGSPKTIEVQIGGTGSGNYTYFWSSSDNSFAFTSNTTTAVVYPIGATTAYYLNVVDNLYTGCNSGDTLLLYALPDQDLVVPNLVTPNGDNKNDYLEIKDKNEKEILPGSSIEIENRWGERVYEHSSYDNTWNAHDLSDGVYYYYIKSGCGNKVSKGWVQIIH